MRARKIDDVQNVTNGQAEEGKNRPTHIKRSHISPAVRVQHHHHQQLRQRRTKHVADNSEWNRAHTFVRNAPHGAREDCFRQLVPGSPHSLAEQTKCDIAQYLRARIHKVLRVEEIAGRRRSVADGDD